ncbi:MAG: helix-turn-helix transcriptional regulator [Myxococcota bacterium]
MAPTAPAAPTEPGRALARALDRALEAVVQRTRLSAREASVLRLFAMGYHHPEIGRELGISPRTVKMHAASLRNKTGTRSRSGLVRLLFAAGA